MEQPESSAGKGPLLRRAQCRVPSEDQRHVKRGQREATLRSWIADFVTSIHRR